MSTEQLAPISAWGTEPIMALVERVFMRCRDNSLRRQMNVAGRVLAAVGSMLGDTLHQLDLPRCGITLPPLVFALIMAAWTLKIDLMMIIDGLEYLVIVRPPQYVLVARVVFRILSTRTLRTNEAQRSFLNRRTEWCGCDIFKFGACKVCGRT